MTFFSLLNAACDAGKYLNASVEGNTTVTACLDCPVDMYCPGSNGTARAAYAYCPWPGTTAGRTGSTSVSNCGRYLFLACLAAAP